MNFSFLHKRRGATLAGICSLALSCVVLLCGAGSVPIENLLPQGAMQGDLNAGGHSLTNAATVSATNVVVSGSLTAPSSFTLSFSQVSGKPVTLSGYGITDPVVLTNGSYANPSWLTSLAYSKLSGAPSLATVATSGSYTDLTSKPTIPAAQVNSDWNASSGLAQILNKPALATVATSGAYGDLSSKPTLGTLASVSPGGTTSSTTFLKFDGTTFSYATPPGATTTGTALLEGNGSGGIANVTLGSGLALSSGTLSANVLSVAGRTGAITLTAADIGGLAASATTDTTSASNITSGTLAAAHVATLNQNTTGSAASFTGSLAGDVTGTQGATTVGKINGTSLAALGTGLLKNTTGSGVPSIASAGADYAGLGVANNFTATQDAPDFQIPTGPNGIIFDWVGDSRTGGPQGGGSPTTAANAPSAGYVNLVPARMQEMGFGYNMTVINEGLGGALVETGLANYRSGEITTTGSVTAGSTTITITGSTTGLSAIMTGNGSMVAGPGIPYGLTATISGSTVTLHDYSGRSRTPTLSTTAATLIFSPTISVSYNGSTPCNETFHELSPAVNTAVYTCTVTGGSNIISLNSGSWAPPVGSTITSAHFSGPVTVTTSSVNLQTITVSANATGSSSTEAVTVVPPGFIAFWYGINDVAQPSVYSSITSTTSSPILTGFSLGSTVLIPGTSVTGTNIPSGATVVSNTSSTVTISANPTAASSSNTVTLTSLASAWGAAYSTLISEAVADGWTVEVLTIPRAFSGNQSTNETLRAAYNSYLVSTYGTETSPLVTGVKLCDVASLGIFNTFDQRIYADTGLHFSPLGNAIIADHVNSVMEAQYPALMNGFPLTLCQNQTIPSDWILFPPGGTNLVLNGGLTLNPGAYNNQTFLNMGSGYMRYNEGSPPSIWYVGGGVIEQMQMSVTGFIPIIPQNATTVSGSTSGTATFVQTFNQGYKKEVIVSCTALVGTASFTFPTAFSNTPVILTTSGPAAAVVTSLSTSAVTVTGSTTTGPLFLEGF